MGKNYDLLFLKHHHFITQKYNLKLPYWWGGKSWDIGANKTWGTYKETYSEEYDNYYYY